MKADTSSSVELLALESATCERWAIAQRYQGDVSELASTAPSLARNPREGYESDYVQLSKHSTETPKSEIWCSLLVFWGKNVYHLCYSLFVTNTNGAFRHKSMGVGNTNTIKSKYFKITFSCILHKKISTLNKKGIKTKTEQFQDELWRAAESWVTQPLRSCSELAGTDRPFS